MKRYKICFVAVNEVDRKGRCSSCADVGDSTNVYGMHYGQYIARKRTGQLPAKTPRQERMEAALKDCIEPPRCRICPICGKEVGPDLRKTYCSWECFHKNQMQREAKYRERKRAEKKGNAT